MEREPTYVDEEVSFHPRPSEINMGEEVYVTSHQSVETQDPENLEQQNTEHPTVTYLLSNLQRVEQLMNGNQQRVEQQMLGISKVLVDLAERIGGMRGADMNGNSAQTMHPDNRTRAPPQSHQGDFEPGYPVNRGNRSRTNMGHRPPGINPVPVKLPTFTGKEKWQVWINRFEAIAGRQGWDEDAMMDQLLPKLDGEAAEFAFIQLPKAVLHDYGRLTRELGSRFGVIETSKTFASKFSRRNQKAGETVEEFAADLKRLYDRAHRGRDQVTRQEDLVRKFLDGLRDDEARFEIEYHKEPGNLDEAVYHAVNFIQTKRSCRSERNIEKREKTYARRAAADKSNNEEEEEAETMRRVPTAPKKEGVSKEYKTEQKSQDQASSPNNDGEILSKIQELIDEAVRRQSGVQNVGGKVRASITCYACGRPGHMARDCGYNQVSQQPRSRFYETSVGNRFRRNHQPSYKLNRGPDHQFSYDHGMPERRYNNPPLHVNQESVRTEPKEPLSYERRYDYRV